MVKGAVGGAINPYVDFDYSGSWFDQGEDFRMGDGKQRPTYILLIDTDFGTPARGVLWPRKSGSSRLLSAITVIRQKSFLPTGVLILIILMSRGMNLSTVRFQ